MSLPSSVVETSITLLSTKELQQLAVLKGLALDVKTIGPYAKAELRRLDNDLQVGKVILKHMNTLLLSFGRNDVFHRMFPSA